MYFKFNFNDLQGRQKSVIGNNYCKIFMKFEFCDKEKVIEAVNNCKLFIRFELCDEKWLMVTVNYCKNIPENDTLPVVIPVLL